jgi:hypothetical protein
MPLFGVKVQDEPNWAQKALVCVHPALLLPSSSPAASLHAARYTFSSPSATWFATRLQPPTSFSTFSKTQKPTAHLRKTVPAQHLAAPLTKSRLVWDQQVLRPLSQATLKMAQLRRLSSFRRWGKYALPTWPAFNFLLENTSGTGRWVQYTKLTTTSSPRSVVVIFVSTPTYSDVSCE